MKEQVGDQRIPYEGTTPAFDFWLREGDRLYREHLEPEEAENCLDLALNEYSRALEQNPQSAAVAGRMSRVFFRQGNYSKAEQYANKCLGFIDAEPIPSSEKIDFQAEAYHVLGMIQYRHGHLDVARKILERAAYLAGFKGARTRLGLFQVYRDQVLTSGFMTANLFTLLLAFYGLMTGLALLPFEHNRVALPTLLLLVPRLLVAWLKEELYGADAALDNYLDLHRDYPGLGSVGIIVGGLYRERGRPEQARAWFGKVIDKHPGDLEAYYHLARLMEEQEDFEGMAQVYGQLIKLRPGDAHLHCHLANAYYYNHDSQAALKYYESALQLGLDNRWKAMVAQSIANIHYDELNNPQAAIAYYQMARSLDPNEIENYIQLGMLYFQREDFANAELVYRKAIPLAPENPRLYSNLGYLRWMEGDIDTALEYYRKAIDLDPDYEIPINNMGVIHLDMLGQVHKAIELFEQAIEIDEHYALAYYNLGRAHSFLGNRLEAANCFRTAQALNHDSHELDNDELTARINHLFDTCEMELRD